MLEFSGNAIGDVQQNGNTPFGSKIVKRAYLQYIRTANDAEVKFLGNIEPKKTLNAPWLSKWCMHNMLGTAKGIEVKLS